MLMGATERAAFGRASVLAFRRGVVRDLAGLPETLARLGSLELKFAITRAEIRAVQKMRYRVFFEQGGAIADPFARAQRRDNCPFDRICDHIIVVDHDYATRLGRRKPRVVGAYRVLRQSAVASADNFYTAGEFDIGRLIERHPDKTFLELGRSCVLPEYRARRVLELLWRGLWVYVRHHGVDVMFGCASLPGADPAAHADALAFLRAHARAGEDWRAPLARRGRAQPKAASPGGAAGLFPDAVKSRRALAGLPPLIKGYLRLGACFGDEFFIDHAFGTTDVLVVLPVANIDERYIGYFSGGPTEAAAA
ncbi:MAG: GNAT family N-acetyltransferase [Beijerinckiaceae bacterium]